MAALIAEELLLLAYTPDGTVHGGAAELDCALGGALLVELVLGGHAELDEQWIMARGGADPPSHPRLAEALNQVASTRRRPQAWVTRLSKGIRRRLLADLVSDGVLADEPYRWLGLVTRHRFPERVPGPRRDAVSRLGAAVLDGHRPDPRTAALAGMVAAAKLERRIFPEADRREVRRRLREIADEPWAADAVRKAIQQVHAATAAASMVASTSTSTSTSASGSDGGGGGGGGGV